MKLIRLATDDEGIFRSAFGNDLVVEKDSKMALLNLTFETEYEVLNISSNNNTLTFKSDEQEAGTEKQVLLNSNIYTGSTYNTFLNNLLYNLNRAIAVDDLQNCMGSQFNIRDYNGKKRIEYRYSPFFNPCNMRLGGGSSQLNVMRFNEATLDVVTGSPPTSHTTISSSTTAVADRTNNMITSARLSNGNGMVIMRIRSSVDNGSGLEDNGVGLGVSKTDLPFAFEGAKNVDIPSNARDFEIRYNRPAENYVFIDDGGLEQTSSIAPQKVNGLADIVEHDTIYFVINDGKIEGGVLQMVTGVAKRQKFFEKFLGDADELYPYIYVRGASANISVDMFNYTLDPWVNQGFSNDADDAELDNDEEGWRFTGQDFSGAEFNAYSNSLLSATTGGNLFNGTGADEFPLPFPTNWQETKVTELTMHSDIWKFLGFNSGSEGYITEKIKIGVNPGVPFPQCWSWWLPQNSFVLTNSDNYIVESMSVPLDSYDASKVFYDNNNLLVYSNPSSDRLGRRKNILMTIPVNDNNNNLVEYETNTPIFISLNNAERLNLKNLNFRILDKNFKSIQQSGSTAIMTILIDN